MSKPFGAETGTFREIQVSVMAADALAPWLFECWYTLPPQ